MPMKIPRGNHGFTLVEAIIATFIVSIVLLSLSGSFSDGIKNLYKGRDKTVKTNLLQQRAEVIKKDIRDGKYEDIETTDDLTNYNGSPWILKQEVSNLPGIDNMKEVKLILKDPDNNQVTDELTFFIYKDGI